jgi:hypothetical protein
LIEPTRQSREHDHGNQKLEFYVDASYGLRSMNQQSIRLTRLRSAITHYRNGASSWNLWDRRCMEKEISWYRYIMSQMGPEPMDNYQENVLQEDLMV